MSVIPPVRRLLIIEDELTTLFALREYFTLDQFVVDCAAAPLEARRLLNALPYDVMLTDLHLTPDRRCEGLELLRYARESAPDICAVLLTAFVSSELEQAALKMGADAVLAKPIALPELAEVIEGITNKTSRLDSGQILGPRR
jgi:DNA-binding response OmpR family regulator